MTQHKRKAPIEGRDRPIREGGGLRLAALRPFRRHNWEYGTRAERRKRLEDAIRFLGEFMKTLDHWAEPDTGAKVKGKKKSRWEFSP